MTESIKFNTRLIRKPLTENRKNDDWQLSSYLWEVSINGQSFDFYCGSGWVNKNGQPKAPKLDDVLHSLIMDSEAMNISFDEWCDNFGYDTDSRGALKTYLACQENGLKLRRTGIDIEAHRERLQDY